MPTFDICRTGTSAECDKVYIQDKTTYPASPDPEARENYALYLVGYFYQESADDIRLEIDNTDPLNTTQWEVTITSDGYHYYDLLPIPVWSGSTSYLIGQIVYENSFYWRALQDHANQQPTNTEGSFWEKVDDPAVEIGNTLSTGAPTIPDIFRYNDVLTCRGDQCYAKVIHAGAKDCCDDCYNTNSRNVYTVDVLLQSTYLLAAQTRYTEAHKTALLLMDKCNDLTDCGCS